MHVGILTHTYTHTHTYRGYKCMSEFFKQGDKEKELGLTVSPQCDRENSNIPAGQVLYVCIHVYVNMYICIYVYIHTQRVYICREGTWAHILTTV